MREVLFEHVLKLVSGDEAVLVLVINLPDVTPDVFPALEVRHYHGHKELLVDLNKAFKLLHLCHQSVVFFHFNDLLNFAVVDLQPRSIKLVEHDEFLVDLQVAYWLLLLGSHASSAGRCD